MGLRETFLNALGASKPVKQDNSALRSARDFLVNGNRDRLYPTWSDIKMPDSDMYSGYAYAVIQKRGNKVASLAKNNLNTIADQKIVDEYQKQGEAVLHPYLKLIEDSTDFTEKQFWKNISIYLDLAGRYYLGVIRGSIKPNDPRLPVITTDPTKFIMLNPYEIRRVVDKNKQVAGYIERKKDGRYREWPVHQIIEMRELNPFNPEESQWAMTDAAKDAVYTINQSGDYTRQSLNGNIDAPGIITTDVLLNDTDFANFRARVTQHQKGEPLFGNGAGAIKWDSMQIDLDKAALLDINEINRTTLFAVSGTSKTSLGIEQSGTTRETARVQSEQFISDTAQPRLEDIVDFLNLDYKKHYPREYKQTNYKIEVQSAVGRDYDTEQKATALKQSQFQLAMTLMQSGYTSESAWQFAEGSIDYEDLELEKGLDKPKNPEQPEDPNENAPTSPQNGPQSGSDGGNDSSSVSENNSLENDLNGLEPHGDLLEGENSLPLDKNERGNHCTCEHDHKLETFLNEVREDESQVVSKEYNEFLEEIREIEKETVNACVRKVTVNAFEESDIIGDRKKKKLIEMLKNTVRKYWWAIFPLFANNSMTKRNAEFDKNVKFVFNNDLQAGVEDNAERVAEGHMNTILGDILEASNKAYANVLEETAAELIIRVYDDSPTKWEKYFEHKPTMADALESIRKTDILEENRRIYEKANKMAFEGYNRRDIIKAIRNEYKDISEKRATLIARNETARAFGRSQFEADKQFLNGIGKMGDAYKIWYSRRPATEQDKICPFCRHLIETSNANPIPFEKPFVEYGNSLEVIEDGKVKIFTANYEDIEGGTLHINCSCGYKLVFKNAQGEFVKTLNQGEKEDINGTSGNLDNNSLDSRVNSVGGDEEATKSLNGGPGSGNFGHSGRPGLVGGSGKTLGLAREKTFRKGDKVEITTVYGKERGIFSGLETEEGVTRAVVQTDSGEIKKVPYDTLFIKMLENRDEGKPASKRERQTVRQKQALESVFSQIKPNNADIKKLYEENCSEEFAVALDNELKLAKADGLDISKVVLKEEKQKYGVATITSGKDGKLYFGIGFNKKLFGGGTRTEKILAENKEKKWTTGTTVNEYIKHELGHIKMFQALMKNQVDYGEVDSYAEAIVVKATGKKWREISAENMESRKEMGGYGNKHGASEMVAESWANPNYSDTTKAIARVLRTGGVTLEETARQTTWNKDTPELIRRVYNSLSREIDICKGLTPSEEIDKKLNER